MEDIRAQVVKANIDVIEAKTPVRRVGLTLHYFRDPADGVQTTEQFLLTAQAIRDLVDGSQAIAGWLDQPTPTSSSRH